MKMSRIQSGQTFMRRFKGGGIEKVRAIVVFSLLAVFVVVQAVMLILATAGVINQTSF